MENEFEKGPEKQAGEKATCIYVIYDINNLNSKNE